MSKEVKRILEEAESKGSLSILAQPAPSASALVIAPGKFCSAYTGKVRPVMLTVVGFLRLFRRGDLANAIASAMGFLDLNCGQAEEGIKLSSD